MTVTTEAVLPVMSVDDLDVLRGSALAFAEESNLPGGLDPDQWVSSWTRLIDAGQGFMLSTECGAAVAGILHPDMNNGDLVCQEAFWFVPKGSRHGIGLDLFAAWEAEASRLGAVRLIMVHLAQLDAARLGKLYQRRGYRPLETSYIKAL